MDYGVREVNDWELIYPAGKGFVRIDGDYHLVSMYHQLHCINAFRRYISNFEAESRNITSFQLSHITHCLSYLRQGTLCNADVSLEETFEAHAQNGAPVHAVYGTGVVHKCQDWTQVRTWADKNHAEWEADDDFEVL